MPIEGGKTRVEVDNGEPYEFDAVVSSLPTKLFLKLAGGLPEDYKRKYDWGDALGAHVAVLALKESLLDPVYWLSIADQGYPFLVVVDHTNMRSTTEYGGRHLLYIGNYLPMTHRYFTQPDEETLAEFIPHLKKAQPEI